MARQLSHQHLRALSDSIRVLYQSSNLEGFPRCVFAAVTPLVRCDNFAYNEFSRDGALRVVHCEPGLPASAIKFLLEIGPEFSKEHPTVSHVTRTGSPEPFKITDFTSQRQWRQTRLYHDFYKPLECEYQMAFASPVADGQVALAFNCVRRDYSEDDRQLLELLRPHLMQAYANALVVTRLTNALQGTGGALLCVAPGGSIRFATGQALRYLERYFDCAADAALLPQRLGNWLRNPVAPLVVAQAEARLQISIASREPDGTCNLLLEEKRDSEVEQRLIALGLTLREAHVLIWVSRGKATSDISIILGCKPATVSKHLDHIYQKLGVENRTAAAAYVTAA